MARKKKNVLENYVCEHQLSFRTINMEIKEDEEWEKEKLNEKIGKE